MITPQKIEKKSETQMHIQWSTGEKTDVPFAELRFHCRCASCVDEWTRVRKVTREEVKPDIKPTLVESVGRYAIQINWNDGHKAGIYPFELLYAIANGKADEYDSTGEKNEK